MVIPQKMTTLKIGSRCEEVKLLQLLLKVDTSGGGFGIYGHRTEHKVITFQRSKGLKTDGIVGNMTWKALALHVPIEKFYSLMGKIDPKILICFNQSFSALLFQRPLKQSGYDFKKPTRTVDTTFLHCSASDATEHDSVDVMDRWHKKRGFNEIGYHFFIKKNGEIQEGRSLSKVPAAQKGHNEGSIAICLHGLEASNFTNQQFKSLNDLCDAINECYTDPIRFRGHKEVSNKACPVFNYQEVLNLDTNGYML